MDIIHGVFINYFAFFFLHRRQLKSLLAAVVGIEDLAGLPDILYCLFMLIDEVKKKALSVTFSVRKHWRISITIELIFNIRKKHLKLFHVLHRNPTQNHIYIYILAIIRSRHCSICKIKGHTSYFTVFERHVFQKKKMY